ncbi:MAG: FAD-binding oxidoreductase [Bacteroidia bacterium]|nr:FAD-binding oxidoreductase [Bacteroidia bacterium]
MSRFVSVAIDEIKDETPDAYTIFFQNPDPLQFTYFPGQYLTVKLDVDGESIRRAFSLSSSPATDDRLSVTIKRVENGLASNFIRDHLTAGDLVEIMPPMGRFYVETDPTATNHYVLIGAGSGITPLMSILKTVLNTEPQSKVSLWYGNRNRASIIFREELAHFSAQYPERLHVHHILTAPDFDWDGPQGRLDVKAIYNLVSELFMTDELRKQYYICGPNGLMDAAEKALDQHAVHPADVHREYYSAPVPTEAEVEAAYASPEATAPSNIYDDGEEAYELITRTITVTVDGKRQEISVAPESFILQAAIAAKLDPPYACQSGICTTCRAMLVSGVVAMKETEGLSTSELEEGFVLTCQSHPLSDGVELAYR